MKMTKNRKLIKDVLEQANRPLSAQEIHQEILDQGQDIWLSTVYRNLEAFLEEDMVLKTKIPPLDEDYYILEEGRHKDFVICIDCKKIIQTLPCPMEDYKKNIKEKDFQIIDHQFLIYGHCNKCH